MQSIADNTDLSRAEALGARFSERYKTAPARLFSSPGRAEIVGNHTDHNLGKVLVASISCDILCAAAEGEEAEIAAEGFRTIRVRPSSLSFREHEKKSSAALVRGVLARLKETGRAVGGFRAVTQSNIFRGAGVSSSAAFSVLIAEIENVLYNGGNIPPEELAACAQYAENVYFGKPCGLLDQMGVALGGLNRIDFSDPLAPVCTRVPPPAGYTLVLVNTGGSHAGMTAHYAAIGAEMKEVAACFGEETLRPVSPARFFEELPSLRKRVSDRALLRAVHYFEENERVDRACEALKAGDVPRFLEQVRMSGESSVKWLQNCAVPGSPSQPLLFALKCAERCTEDGAFRMMGGGFAGTVLAILREGTQERYCLEMARIFGEENVFRTEIRREGTCEWKIPRKRFGGNI